MIWANIDSHSLCRISCASIRKLLVLSSNTQNRISYRTRVFPLLFSPNWMKVVYFSSFSFHPFIFMIFSMFLKEFSGAFSIKMTRSAIPSTRSTLFLVFFLFLSYSFEIFQHRNFTIVSEYSILPWCFIVAGKISFFCFASCKYIVKRTKINNRKFGDITENYFYPLRTETYTYINLFSVFEKYKKEKNQQSPHCIV